MARQLLGIVTGAVAAFVAVLLAISLLFAISLAGAIALPDWFQSVMLCLAVAVAAYVAARVGRTGGAVLGVVTALFAEAVLIVFQREGSAVQPAAYENDLHLSTVSLAKLWFAARIVVGMIAGIWGARSWARKAARMEMGPEPEAGLDEQQPAATGADSDAN